MHGSGTPSAWLQRWAHLLAAGGDALDLACGSGRHLRWLAAQGWAASREFSRMCYAGAAPGQPVAAPPPAPTDPAAGAPHFAVILLRFDRLEWLWLAAAGHQRALFSWGETPSATWLSP